MKAFIDLSRFLSTSNSVKYHPVEGDEASRKECFCSSVVGERTSKATYKTRLKLCLWPLFVVQSIVIFILVIDSTIHQTPSDITCARKLSPYCRTNPLNFLERLMLIQDLAPFLDSGDLEYKEFTDKNHLMQPSIYRGLPTPETEQAWIELWRSTYNPLHVIVLLVSPAKEYPSSASSHTEPHHCDSANHKVSGGQT